MNKKNGDGIDYLDVTYTENDKPRTDFPFKLAKHIVDKFDLKENNKILDVGCGRCEVLTAFGQLGLDISGVDASERIQSFAPKEISKLEIWVPPKYLKTENFSISYVPIDGEFLQIPDPW